MGVLFFIFGFGFLIYGNIIGLPILLIGILLFALCYMIYFYYPKVRKMEAEDKKNRYQEELKRKYGDLFLRIVEDIKKF